ncbi:hypothetical protein [Methanospirillum sp.]
MLSAINSTSYKSSFEPEGIPRDEEEIREEIRKAEQQIEDLLEKFGGYTTVAAGRLNLDVFFEEMDRLRLILPPLYDDLENLEEELKKAIYEPDFDLMAKEEDL